MKVWFDSWFMTEHQTKPLTKMKWDVRLQMKLVNEVHAPANPN